MLAVLRRLLVVLATLASLVGLLRPDVYRAPDVIRAAWQPNDVVTLLVAVPLLVWTAGRAERGHLRGQLVELGALHYLLYDYAFYLFGASLNFLFLVYVAIVAGAAWAIFFAAREIDLAQIQRPRAGRAAAWFAFIAAGLTMTWCIQWLVAMTRTTPPTRFDLTPDFVRVVGAIDLTMMVSVLVPAAVLLRRKRPEGIVLGIMLGVSGALYNLVLAGGTLVQVRMGLAGAVPMLALWIALGIGSAIAALRLASRAPRPAPCFVSGGGDRSWNAPPFGSR